MTNDPDDWRHFRRQRNKYNNDIKTAGKKYYSNRLTLPNNKNKKDITLKENVINDNTLLVNYQRHDK